VKIYLVRHGESVDDIEDCYGGIADFPLTDSGRVTAEELANKLATSGITTLYTSPYKRASETAGFICKVLGCEASVIEDLRERNSYGVLSGVNKAKAKSIFPHVFALLKGKVGDYYSSETVVGAESKEEFDVRVRAAFTRIIEESGDHDTIGIVTHGNVTRSIYQNIINVDGKVELKLLAITVIDYSPSSIKIERNEGVEIL
jgi:broad specificity phosphatase PhoE